MSSASTVNDGQSATGVSADVSKAPSPATLVSKQRRYLMLTLFCLAEFFDSFMASGLFPAINDIQIHLNVAPAETTWAFAAYSATFSAFLLISGRVSDVYSSRWCFIVGAFIIGAFSLGGGFPHTKVAFFILRAFAGIGAALNVPAALSLIVEWFPEPEEQGMAIALFGTGGGIGNILGVVIGGIFVEYASWRWIMYFVGIAAISISVLSIVVVPPSPPRAPEHKPSWKRLDLGGVSLITIATILFVYAVTSGPVNGWGSANVIAPLIISVVMAAVFFFYESRIDPELAALPPRVWKYDNVPVLILLGLIPFFWWGSLFYSLMPIMQSEYHWSALMASVHFLPAGISGTLIAGFASSMVKYVSPKWSISFGLVLEIIATLLLPFANTKEKYWSYLFPSFFIGSIGTMIIYVNANIAVFMNTPPAMAGVAGAMFNSALQLGVAVFIAILSSITQSVDKKRVKQGKEPGYHGIAAGYWFVLAWVCFVFIMVQVFYTAESRKAAPVTKDVESNENDENYEGAEKGDGEKQEREPHMTIAQGEAGLATVAIEEAAVHHNHSHAQKS